MVTNEKIWVSEVIFTSGLSFPGVILPGESNGNVHFGIPCFRGAARLLAQLLPELSHNPIFPGVILPGESNGNVHFGIPCFSGGARLVALLLPELAHNPIFPGLILPGESNGNVHLEITHEHSSYVIPYEQ